MEEFKAQMKGYRKRIIWGHANKRVHQSGARGMACSKDCGSSSIHALGTHSTGESGYHTGPGPVLTVWRLDRETLHARLVDLSEAAAELHSGHRQLAEALASGAVFETRVHFFCMTLDQFIAARNACSPAASVI
jgi:hypothetical protein